MWIPRRRTIHRTSLITQHVHRQIEKAFSFSFKIKLHLRSKKKKQITSGM